MRTPSRVTVLIIHHMALVVSPVCGGSQRPNDRSRQTVRLAGCDHGPRYPSLAKPISTLGSAARTVVLTCIPASLDNATAAHHHRRRRGLRRALREGGVLSESPRSSMSGPRWLGGFMNTTEAGHTNMGSANRCWQFSPLANASGCAPEAAQILRGTS
ncbi:hypothetical protein EDB83DRAFT_2346047 [Lactarius deliciosus]|nr:hypothetical protein EDB83DRAFT_2346047 [Lactarius deliciosus]